MQFSDVIGQDAIKRQLVQMVQQNRISHAQLFLGKEGSGGLPLALAFAQYINCERVNGISKPPTLDLFGNLETPAAEDTSNATVVQDACGVCNACKKAAQLIHPDIHYSYPIFPRKPGAKSKCTDFVTEWRSFVHSNPYGNSYDWLQHAGADNQQGNINVYECEDIQHKISLKPFESAYKILILWMPETLGKEGNKLLKLIEEPPPNTLFIFVAENEALILPTIISRTQLVKLPPLSAPEIAEGLVKNNLATNTAHQIALLADGNYREALQQLAHTDDDWEVLLRDWLNAIVRKNKIAQLKWIEGISKQGREKQKQFLKYFIHLLQQAIRLSITEEANNAASPGLDFAHRLNKICGLHQQEAMMQELDKASYYVERNANAKLLFHALTIKFYHIISNNSVILVR